MEAPKIIGIAISIGIKFWPTVKVVIIARPMPTIPNIFPLRAVCGEDKPLNARIKKIAATRYKSIAIDSLVIVSNILFIFYFLFLKHFKHSLGYKKTTKYVY